MGEPSCLSASLPLLSIACLEQQCQTRGLRVCCVDRHPFCLLQSSRDFLSPFPKNFPDGTLNPKPARLYAKLYSIARSNIRGEQ